MYISQTDASAKLAKYHDLILGCYNRAWDKWLTQIAPIFSKPCSRYRANTINELVIHEARRVFGVDEWQSEVKILELDRFLLLIKPARLMLIFKKLDEDFKTSNVRTKRAEMFDAQMEMEGIPSWPRLTLGYQIDQLGTKIEVFIMYQKARRHLWSYALELVAPSNVIEFPSASKGEEDNKKGRIRAKVSRVKEQLQIVNERQLDGGSEGSENKAKSHSKKREKDQGE